MTAFKSSPAFNNFVKNQMIHDARDLLDHINNALTKWGLAEYRLTGESIPFVVDAVQDFLNDMHESTDQKKFIFEYTRTSDQSIDSYRSDADLTMQSFICSKLRDQFLQCAPQNVFRRQTLQLEPAIKILALQLLDKTMQRQLAVVGGLDDEYQKLFIEHGEDIAYPAARSFMHAVGQIFVRIQKPLDVTNCLTLFERLARDFYKGDIPSKTSGTSSIMSDQIFVELKQKMQMIYDAAKPIAANDING
jgi:hypothetical protein